MANVINLQRTSLNICANQSAGEAQVDVAHRTQRNGGPIHAQCAFLNLITLQSKVPRGVQNESVSKPFENEYRAVFSVIKDYTNLSTV